MSDIMELYHPTWEINDSSKVQCFMDCPRKFFFNYVLGWETDAPNNDLIFGQAIHEALEFLMTSSMKQDAIDPAFEKFLKVYREHFSEETDELFEPKSPKNAFFGLCVYVGKYRDQDQFETLYTEIGGEVNTGDHNLVYKIDAVCKDQNDRVFALEHKTTKMGFRQVWFDEWLLSMQIGTYSYALRCMFPEVLSPIVIVNGLSFSKKKVDCERLPVKKTQNQLRTWLFTMNYWLNNIKTERDVLTNDCSVDDSVLTAFPMNPRACTNYFRLCPYHEFCTAWPNPLRQAFDGPPGGYKLHYWNPLEELPLKNRKDFGKTAV